MSWKPEIKVHNDPKFYDNAVRFATAEEAIAYAKDLEARWTSAEEIRVTETKDPVTGEWIDGKMKWRQDLVP